MRDIRSGVSKKRSIKNWTKNIKGHIATVPTCNSGTLTNVLPHKIDRTDTLPGGLGSIPFFNKLGSGSV